MMSPLLLQNLLCWQRKLESVKKWVYKRGERGCLLCVCLIVSV